MLASTTNATRSCEELRPQFSVPETSPCRLASPSANIFAELILRREASSSLRLFLGDPGKLVSRRTDAGSNTFTAHPNRHAKDAAACSCARSACNVVASSATVACSLETTKTAYSNLNNRIQIIKILVSQPVNKIQITN